MVFKERGKPEEYPQKNLSEQRREPTTNSTHTLGTANTTTTTKTTSKNNRFNDQNNGSARASRVLVHFFDVDCTTTT